MKTRLKIRVQISLTWTKKCDLMIMNDIAFNIGGAMIQNMNQAGE